MTSRILLFLLGIIAGLYLFFLEAERFRDLFGGEDVSELITCQDFKLVEKKVLKGLNIVVREVTHVELIDGEVAAVCNPQDDFYRTREEAHKEIRYEGQIYYTCAKAEFDLGETYYARIRARGRSNSPDLYIQSEADDTLRNNIAELPKEDCLEGSL